MEVKRNNLKKIKSIRNLFKLKKENEAIKDRIIIFYNRYNNTYIRTLFEQEKVYCKPITGGNFWNNNHIECGSSGDRNKNLSTKVCLDKIKTYLRDIIINFKKSDTI